ncbi:MAG: hypothetical protein IPO00_09665 [Betaproteobacteria bacterium]|nr:hypothetical protein [Betaproteobacteria bacterium]
MADTLGMTLVLRGDAKGIVAEMKNAQGAVVETARIMRDQLGSASKATTNQMMELKKGMGQARETAMFFTQSLGEFGPAGRTAQIAVSGIAGAIMGGGGILLALSLAQAAVRLLVDWWKADAEKATEAAKKHLEAAEALEKYNRALSKDANAHIATLEGMKQGFSKLTEAQKAHNVVQEINVLKLMATAPAMKAMLDLRLKQAQLLEQEIALEEKKAKAAVPAEKKAKAENKPWEKSFDQQVLEAESRIKDEQAREDFEREKKSSEASWKLQEEEAKRLTKIEGEMMEAAKQLQQQWTAVGSTISGAFSDIGTIIGGAAQSWMAYFGQLIQKAIQLAIAMASTAGPLGWLNAAAAGIAVISAVASVPEFRAMGGPVTSGSPYIVGERGPELFVPSQSGGIVPNHAMGGVTVNISAMDAKSVRRLLLDNGPALAEAIRRAASDGRLG